VGRGHPAPPPPYHHCLFQISRSATVTKCLEIVSYYKTSHEKYNGYFKDDIQKLAELYMQKGRGPGAPTAAWHRAPLNMARSKESASAAVNPLGEWLVVEFWVQFCF